MIKISEDCYLTKNFMLRARAWRIWLSDDSEEQLKIC